MRWTIKAFVVRDDDTVIDEWECTVRDKVKAKFDARLRFMRDRTVREWPYDYAHQLKGTDGIYEIKFEYDNIAYRPLFFIGPGEDELTVLVFCEESNDILRPKGCIATAERRKQLVLENLEMAIEYEP